jgi:hypothetical protein
MEENITCGEEWEEFKFLFVAIQLCGPPSSTILLMGQNDPFNQLRENA